MISYNYDLFMNLFIIYWFVNGFVWAINSITKDGEPRHWHYVGAVDGVVIMLMVVVPAVL